MTSLMATEAASAVPAVLRCVPLAPGTSNVDRSRVGRPPVPLQVVARIRQREGAVTAEPALDRLRASYADLLASLTSRQKPPACRAYVVLSSHAVRCLDQVSEWLLGLGFDAVRLAGEELTALVAPEHVEEHLREVQAGPRWARTLPVVDCPPDLSGPWLRRLLVVRADIDVSLHVQPSGTRFVEASLSVTVWADRREELDHQAQRVKAVLAAHLLRTRGPLFDAMAAFVSGLPLGSTPLGWRQRLTIEAPTVMLQQAYEDLVPGTGGLLYGIDPGPRTPLVVDRFAVANPDAVVIGRGASDLARVELVRARLAGIRLHVVDTRGEYTSLVRALGGVVTRLRTGTAIPFRPFALPAGHEGALSARIAALLGLFEVLCDGLSPAQREAVDRALSLSYALCGQTDDGAAPTLRFPDLTAVAAALEGQTARASGAVAAELRALRAGLEPYLEGPGRWLFETAPQAAGAADLTAHDLAEVPDEDLAAAAFLSLDHACSNLAVTRRRALVLVDGVSRLRRHPAFALLLGEARRTVAAAGAGLTLIVDGLGSRCEGPLAEMVERSGLKGLAGQSPATLPELARLLRLTPAEQSWLLQAGPGEGLLAVEGVRRAFQLLTTAEERSLISGGVR